MVDIAFALVSPWNVLRQRVAEELASIRIYRQSKMSRRLVELHR